MIAWPHQTKCTNDVLEAIARGVRRVCVTTPTGGGKTWEMGDLTRDYVDRGKKVVLYTNRRLLVSQTSGVFGGFELEHGVRAAGHEENKHLPFQVSSIQTEDARVNKKKTWKLHAADLVLVDEAHLIKGPVAREIFQRHHDDGAVRVGYTATPLDLEEMYDELIVAGRPSELRKCGALVPAVHYACDEPDLRALRKLKKIPADGEDFSENQARAAMMNPSLIGRVWKWFEQLNPDHRPTILFAPGVAESLWFAEQFWKKGITAAHVASRQVWMNGEWLPSGTPEEELESKKRVLEASRIGECVVICNRFVLREGIDAPWLVHGIFATIFGSPQTYIQSGGRLLRAFAGKERATIQDHGGNWWRHDSLNADRHWDLRYTAGMVVAMRAERCREKKCVKCGTLLGSLLTCSRCGHYNETEPWTCRGCGKVVRTAKCDCGFQFGPKRSRPVVTTDGDLMEMTGDVFVPRRLCRKPNGEAIWRQMYYRSLRGRGIKTFNQARACYARENNWGWPPKDWPLMPIDEMDFHRLVPDVPMERLR